MATVRHSLYQKTKHSQNDIWKSLFLQTFVNIVLAALFIIVEQSVKQKFRGGPTEPQMHWNFLALHIKNAPVTRSQIHERAQRQTGEHCLSVQSTRVLLAGLAIGGGANEVQNFTASAYSVWSDRTFYCTGYSTILINATRTLLTKACKSGFYLIVAFWLRFLFVAELIWAVAAIFHSEANTAGSE